MGQSIRHLLDEFPEITVQDFKVEKINIATQSLVIDFSSPDYLSEILNTCVDQKLPLVIGTTGLNSNHHESISKAKQTIPILMGSNMSIGIANLKQAIKNFLMSSQESFSCDLIETHHTQKVDSPSGTAIEIMRFLEGLPGDKIQMPISVHSYRVGKVFGAHRVEFHNPRETISFQHIAHSRDIFASGAIAAAQWIVSNPPGLYSFDDYLTKKL
jgi:4-hydroxy-tetrahydrodipicolinate reductase